MNKEDIIAMAQEAGCNPFEFGATIAHVEDLERFATLVVSAEREEILAFASSEAFNRQHGERSPYAYELANAIRARGQA